MNGKAAAHSPEASMSVYQNDLTRRSGPQTEMGMVPGWVSGYPLR